MTIGFLMGFPNTSSGTVQQTDGGILYDPNQGNIYGVAISGTTLNGIRKWDAYPNGNDLRARNVGDLGGTGAVSPVHCLLAYAKQIVMSNGTSNSASLNGYDMGDMSYTNSFGENSSNIQNSTAFRILASRLVCAFLDNRGRDVVVATPILSGALTGGCELNFVSWGTKSNNKANIVENHAVLGSLPDGSGRNAWALGYSLGTTTMQLYRMGAALGGVGVQAAVGALTPHQIDATWTNVTDVNGIAVDQKDGNLILGFATTDAVTNRAYILKLNSTTAAVMWKIPVGAGLNDPLDQSGMARSVIKNGKFYYIGATGNQLYIIDTIAGTADTSIVMSTGTLDVLHGQQISEDVSGSVIWYGGWNESGLHPAYLGNYCLTQGHTSGSQMGWRFWPALPPAGFVAPVRGDQIFSRKRAWTFTLDGHTFYVLDMGQEGTFLWDKTTNQWTQFITKGYVGWNFANGCMWGQRVIAGDMLTTDIWEMSPGSLFDNGATEIIHVVTGGIATRNRIYHSVESFTLAASVATLLDPAGASVTLSFSDDQGVTWTTMDTLPLTGATSQEIAWTSLGSFCNPGRVFKITDSGGFLRIDGADAQIDNFDEQPPAGDGR